MFFSLSTFIQLYQIEQRITNRKLYVFITSLSPVEWHLERILPNNICIYYP